MILHFVYKLDSYSGAALQAIKLAKMINTPYLFVNYTNASTVACKGVDSVINVKPGAIKDLISLVRLLSSAKVSLLHFHGFFPIAIIIGWIFNKRMLIKTTMLGGDDFESFSRSIKGVIKLAVAKLVDYNVVLTTGAYRANAKYFDQSKISIIPNGVNLEESSGVVAKEHSFCFSGLVCPRKRPDLAITFFAKNYANLINSKLYICGPYKDVVGSVEYNEEYVNYCLGLPKKLNIEDRVIFTGYLEKDKLNLILEKSIALLFFSEKEGLSNAVLEAMSFNCQPIVSQKLEDYLEIMGNNMSCFIIDPERDCIRIEDIIHSVNNNFPASRVKQMFSFPIVASLYLKLYDEILHS